MDCFQWEWHSLLFFYPHSKNIQIMNTQEKHIMGRSARFQILWNCDHNLIGSAPSSQIAISRRMGLLLPNPFHSPISNLWSLRSLISHMAYQIDPIYCAGQYIYRWSDPPIRYISPMLIAGPTLSQLQFTVAFSIGDPLIIDLWRRLQSHITLSASHDPFAFWFPVCRSLINRPFAYRRHCMSASHIVTGVLNTLLDFLWCNDNAPL